MTVQAYVVGARGLLGAELGVRLGAEHELIPSTPLAWSGDDAAFSESVQVNLRALDPERDWIVAWCAGASVTGATDEAVAAEVARFSTFLELLARRMEGGTGQGMIFYASSAGGVYAGSVHPPFTEQTVPRPLAPYGRGKLEAEALLRAFGERIGVKTLTGRISNLYGPGQSLNKPQGLISHLARAQLTPVPASIYVPLETTRDYIHVRDAASLISDCIDRMLREPDPTAHVTKIIAAGQDTSIAALLGHFAVLSKMRSHVVLGSSGSAAYQAVDLRLRSVVWPDLDRRDLISLPEGIHSVLQTILMTVQGGTFNRV